MSTNKELEQTFKEQFKAFNARHKQLKEMLGRSAAKNGATIHHTGNEMRSEAVHEFSAAINVAVLRDHRLAVGRRTQEIAG